MLPPPLERTTPLSAYYHCDLFVEYQRITDLIFRQLCDLQQAFMENNGGDCMDLGTKELMSSVGYYIILFVRVPILMIQSKKII